MAVLRPLKVVIENYPEGQVETISLPLNPDRPEDGSRAVPFSRELYVERDDFMEEPPKKFFRLAPGREVRLDDSMRSSAASRSRVYVTAARADARPGTARWA